MSATISDYLPWTAEQFKPGDRVTWTVKAIEHNIPTRSRRGLVGKVVKVITGESGATWSVSVLWDTYKRPHRYAGSFITKTKRGAERK